ncbi:Membrane lipoprotein TmpC [bioreactor metagenome]|uniref:Membrane lipoprotein TmpC n=1 Tax=bioreactor metagenome TaxID=1076179 RepID=A0A644Z1A4_9ZZZZ
MITLTLAIALVFSLAACSGGTSSTPAPSASASASPSPSAAAGYEIALVTDVGNIDDKSFNEGAWNGVKAYAESAGKTYAYYRPSEDSTEARVEAIGNAIDKGAKVVVCPGYMFAESTLTVQEKYPNVNFLALDVASSDMGDKVASNTALITYQEEQAGYFAGYAVVKDGYTKLGFLGGMAVPAVVRYGYGFVQGADAAAKEMGITVDMKYWYCGGFAPSDDIKIKMDGWYTDGTQIVFACGGGIYLSAVSAAQAAGGKMVGVDVDQYFVDQCVVTSAMKYLKDSVVVALTELYKNDSKWPASYAGKQTVLGAAQNCVGIPTADTSWRFKTFTVKEYQDLYAKVVAGTITVSNAIDKAPTVTNVKVDYQN